jgi:hypothetical protein
VILYVQVDALDDVDVFEAFLQVADSQIGHGKHLLLLDAAG